MFYMFTHTLFLNYEKITYFLKIILEIQMLFLLNYSSYSKILFFHYKYNK